MSLAVSSKSPKPHFSSYTIVSERFPGGGYGILNPISGAIDIVTDDIGLALRNAFGSEHNDLHWTLNQRKAQGIINNLPSETYDSFLERGHITTLPISTERKLVREIAIATHEAQRCQQQFMIAPTLNCNYRCTYCYERPLQTEIHNSKSSILAQNNATMTSEHIHPIFDSIEKIKKEARGRRGGQIILYGGEPLDSRNFDIVEKIITRGINDGYTFVAVTNGHDLDHYVSLLGERKIETIQISLDGPKSIHDSRRIHIGGESSFDKITKNISFALEKTNVEIQLRVHVDPSNLSFFESIVEFFKSQGWTSNPRIIIYANTVYSKSKSNHVSAEFDTGELNQLLHLFARRYLNIFTSAPAVHSARLLTRALVHGERFQSKGTYCSANIGNYIFAPNWQIYACWESIGKQCSSIGSYLNNELILDEVARKKWFGRSIASIPECLKCAFALVCGGGCAQFSEYNNGSIYGPYCNDFQHFFSDFLADELDCYIARQLSTAN